MNSFRLLAPLLSLLFIISFSCAKTDNNPGKKALFFSIDNYYRALPERKKRYNLVKREVKKQNITPLEFKLPSLSKGYGNMKKIILINPGAYIFAEPFTASYLTGNPDEIEFNENVLITYDLPELKDVALPVFNITYKRDLLLEKLAGFCTENSSSAETSRQDSGSPNFVFRNSDPWNAHIWNYETWKIKSWDLQTWHISDRINQVKNRKSENERKCFILIHNSYPMSQELKKYARSHNYSWYIYSNGRLNPENLTQKLESENPRVIVFFSFENNRIMFDINEDLLKDKIILEYKTIHSSLFPWKSYQLQEDYNLLLKEGLAGEEFKKFILENSGKKQNFISHTVDNKNIITIKEAKSKKVFFQ